eukprot:206098_1
MASLFSLAQLVCGLIVLSGSLVGATTAEVEQMSSVQAAVRANESAVVLPETESQELVQSSAPNPTLRGASNTATTEPQQQGGPSNADDLGAAVLAAESCSSCRTRCGWCKPCEPCRHGGACPRFCLTECAAKCGGCAHC